MSLAKRKPIYRQKENTGLVEPCPDIVWAAKHNDLKGVHKALEKPECINDVDPFLKDIGDLWAIDRAIDINSEDLIELFYKHMFPERETLQDTDSEPPNKGDKIIRPKFDKSGP